MSQFIPDWTDVVQTENCPMSWNTCTDTDGGIVPFVQGTVSGTWFGIPYEATDFCLCDQDTLAEFYCEDGFCGDVARMTFVDCEDGACIEEQVPEFGTIAAGVALVGALAGFLLLRRR
ncbi:MAG: hypothetical protein V1735_01480 [Nanoarchaeota archaeon]